MLRGSPAPPWYNPGVPWWMKPPKSESDFTDNQKKLVRRRAQVFGKRTWFVMSPPSKIGMVFFRRAPGEICE